jgi:hydroxypyruvate isomerase
MKRRHAIKTLAAATAAAFLQENLSARVAAAEAPLDPIIRDKVRHSACRWCYSDIPLEQLAQKGKEIGLQAIDLLGPDEWAIVQKHGLTCSMALHQPDGYGITKGFNRRENHAVLLEWYRKLIPQAANAGLQKVICFSGNRNGLSDEKGIKNCATALRQLMPLAAKHKITLCMELLNSKVDHQDYQCDHTAWGVELVKATDSEHFKLLYDIYHMQIMEGDVVRTIRDNQAYIGHYHTGGVPGRNEIDETQELHYPAIMRAIVETGYQGYVAQEFIPKNTDKLASLKKCVQICDVGS